MVNDTREPGNGGGLDPSGGASREGEAPNRGTERTDLIEISDVVWQDGSPGYGVIKLRGATSDGAAAGGEIAVGRPGCNNHSLAVSSCGAERGDRASGIDLVWVESAEGETSPVGRIMLQRFNFVQSKPGVADSILAAVAANDNATWLTDTNGTGVIGCEPSIASLDSSDRLIAWVGTDGHAHGCLVPPGEGDVPSEYGDAAGAARYAAVNAALADLGPVATGADGSRRLLATEPRPGTFAVMWIALDGNAHVLRANAFATPTDARADDSPGAGWARQDMADIPLPKGFTGAFSLKATGDDSGDLVVTYSGAGGERAAIDVPARRIDATGIGGEMRHARAELPVDSVAASGPSGDAMLPASIAHSHATRTDAPAGNAATHLADTRPQHHETAAAGTERTAPIVEATRDGFIALWRGPGAAEGAVSIEMTMFDARGKAIPVAGGRTVIEVADDADAAVTPAIAGIGAGAVAAYVIAGEGGLVVKVYGANGAQIGSAVVDTAEAGAISEISIGAQLTEREGYKEQFAVVYVQDNGDAGQAGYGNLMLQRYGMPVADGVLQPPVELGRDGRADGSDGPVQLTIVSAADPAFAEAVVGRAPSLVGLSNGDLAIVWVESDGVREVVRGDVLEPDGTQLLLIDLTDLLPLSGISEGSKPVLLQVGDGDILVSWLQPDGSDGGHVAMAALYRAEGPGAWSAPLEPIRLESFHDQPKDFSVAVSEGEEISVTVTWQKDSSGSGGDDVLSRRYDLQGNALGPPIDLTSDLDEDRQLSADASSAVGLLDGSIVVVYREDNGDGAAELAAHVVDARGVEGSDIVDTDLGVGGIGATVGGTDPGIVANGSAFSTGVGEEIAIDVLASDQNAGLAVSRVDGIPIAVATPVAVDFGWVQLREDGRLTINPDVGYGGPIAFDYTVADRAGSFEETRRVTVNVEADGAIDPSTGSDTFVFAPGFGNDAIDLPGDANDDRSVVDLSSTGFATFQQLLDAGALAQVGTDVVITLDPADPHNADKITLRGVDLSVLTDSDFKFS